MSVWKRGLGSSIVCTAVMLIGSALAGCGGGSKTLTPVRTVLTAVYSGSQKQTRAVGDTGTVELDLKQSSPSTALSGTGRLTLNGQIYTGPITGTVTGSSAAISVHFQTYGDVNYTVTFDTAGTPPVITMNGTFTHIIPGGTNEGGTVTISQQVGVQTVTVTGNYTGQFLPSDQPSGTLTVRLVQTGNDLMVTGSAGGDSFSGTGTIIGQNITYGTISNDSGTATYSGVATGSQITGTYSGIASDGSGDTTNGTWQITKTE